MAEGEWGNLFDSHDCNVIDTALSTFIDEIIVNLTTAKDDFLDLSVRDQIR